MKKISLIFMVLLLGISSSAFSQMEGLWVVTKITHYQAWLPFSFQHIQAHTRPSSRKA